MEACCACNSFYNNGNEKSHEESEEEEEYDYDYSKDVQLEKISWKRRRRFRSGRK